MNDGKIISEDKSVCALIGIPEMSDDERRELARATIRALMEPGYGRSDLVCDAIRIAEIPVGPDGQIDKIKRAIILAMYAEGSITELGYAIGRGRS